MSMFLNVPFACFSGTQTGMLLRQRLCLQWGLSPRHLCWCLFSDQMWSQCKMREPSPLSTVYLPSRIHRKSTACMQSLWVLFSNWNTVIYIFQRPLHVSLSSFLLVGLPTGPVVTVGCDSNDDCPDYTSCRNRKCINPCAVDKPCAPSALCKVVNHNPVCTCPNGYIGSPHTRCTPRKSPNNKVEMILYCQVYESKTWLESQIGIKGQWQ